MPAFARALADMEPISGNWCEQTQKGRAEYLEWSEPTDVPGPVNLGKVVQYLRECMGPGDVMCNGAGTFASWVHRFFRYPGFGSQLAPTSGSMGYGLPAAVSAKRMRPNNLVVAICGDGDVMMTSQEIATAVHHGIAIIAVIVNNGTYGTIRMHQERDYPGHVIATDITNPDFVLFAQSFGAFGERVEKTEEFGEVFERARASGRPALIELMVNKEAITPSATLSGIREAANSQE